MRKGSARLGPGELLALLSGVLWAVSAALGQFLFEGASAPSGWCPSGSPAPDCCSSSGTLSGAGMSWRPSGRAGTPGTWPSSARRRPSSATSRRWRPAPPWPATSSSRANPSKSPADPAPKAKEKARRHRRRAFTSVQGTEGGEGGISPRSVPGRGGSSPR